MDQQKEEISLLKNIIADLQKNEKDWENRVKISKTKEEYLKSEVKKNHKIAENLQNELNKLNETLEKYKESQMILKN